jgi:LCP family protein required for cell wall assembly
MGVGRAGRLGHRRQKAPAGGTHRRTWRQRLVLTTGAVVAFACLVGAAGVAYGTWQLGRVQRYPVDLIEAASGTPENYLIVGSDSRDNIDPEDPDAGAFLDGEAGGERTDTIMIARVDPSTEQMATLAIPRDLWVTIAGGDDHQRINTAYAGGRQQLIDTIQQNLGIEVNHYIEIDFTGFQGLVDSVDGVPMYFSTAMHDRHSGLEIDASGCTTLDGDQALALARSRSLVYWDAADGDWDTDPTGDLGRITRQQELIRRSLDRAVGLDLANPAHLNELVNVGVENVAVDETLGFTDLVSLAKRFASFGGDELMAYSLPTTPFTTGGGAEVLAVDEPVAEEVLNVFRGLPAGTVTEGSVQVDVMNGTGEAGRAAEVAGQLEAAGFGVGETGNTPSGAVDRTVVRYAPGGDAAAELVARHLGAGADLAEDAALEPGAVVLDVGTDFTTVEATARPEGETGGPTTTAAVSTTVVPVPNEEGTGVVMVPVPDPDAPTTTAAPSTTVAPTTSTTVEGIPEPSTTSSSVVGVAPGDPPSGEACS